MLLFIQKIATLLLERGVIRLVQSLPSMCISINTFAQQHLASTLCKTTAGTEEVTLLLEDMGLNLQFMMASRFVRPFAEEVRKWEQRLSLVSECIEIWMLVQRKWMYLESIFMDSDDIRHQLPQVGHLDKTFCNALVSELQLISCRVMIEPETYPSSSGVRRNAPSAQD